MAATDGEAPAYELATNELPEYAEGVLDIVDQIPEGMVLAYGDVAEMLGRGGPRQVGAVLSRYGSSVSWWRVIRASGQAPDGLRDEALSHWREEGTALVAGSLAGRRVDMNKARWDGRGGRPRFVQDDTSVR
ncbi:MAG: MGMT family protein [Dermatophilaceae bacterium]